MEWYLWGKKKKTITRQKLPTVSEHVLGQNTYSIPQIQPPNLKLPQIQTRDTLSA